MWRGQIRLRHGLHADYCSYPLRRLFVRGTIRQLGHPALLAASYSGNGAAVAAAAVVEVEEGLLVVLEELSRLQPAGGGADAGSLPGGRPDWTHILVNVLPALPSTAKRHSALFSNVGDPFRGPGGGGFGTAEQAASDAKVSASLKVTSV
jgi:hypothetical protein